MTPALLKRVESAREGSRELDAAIARAFSHDVESDDGDWWWGPFNEPPVRVPDFSSSLDAAVSLCARVCPDAFWRVGHAEPDDPYEYTATVITSQGKVIRADHDATPALALVLATLRAVEK